MIIEGNNARHAYEATCVPVGSISKGGLIAAGTIRTRITIHAYNRTAAASLARKHGYEVCDMNMVG